MSNDDFYNGDVLAKYSGLASFIFGVLAVWALVGGSVSTALFWIAWSIGTLVISFVRAQSAADSKALRGYTDEDSAAHAVLADVDETLSQIFVHTAQMYISTAITLWAIPPDAPEAFVNDIAERVDSVAIRGLAQVEDSRARYEEALHAAQLRVNAHYAPDELVAELARMLRSIGQLVATAPPGDDEILRSAMGSMTILVHVIRPLDPTGTLLAPLASEVYAEIRRSASQSNDSRASDK